MISAEANSTRTQGHMTDPADHCSRPKDLQPDLSLPIFKHTDSFGSSPGEIDDPVPGVWTTIVDFHHHRFAGLQISDPDPGTKLQFPMRRRQSIPIIGFTTGRLVAIQGIGVIRSHTFLDLDDFLS